ncbi:Leo1-like protein-domain-containing protein [Talaromyces proteolyticus]|uniref:Leo1-like protein-domain-containing protein n=1 Tax=Talaromyces proteolyticus TaxID=1131652 RepID=A0AAD4KII6_9EURO|nr:Leo1-like protein-domain-containing protein [Talaromyces proteolyticus]KAH8693038.1 Leo1-like protein-domain-containing protein [Talaromyces proteolyticus]
MSSSEDEDVRRPGRNMDGDRGRLNSDDANSNLSGSEADQANDADDKDLFGSDSEGGLEEPPHRSLNDPELDSGDDEGRYDRMDDRMDLAEDGGYEETLKVMDLSLGRAPEPQTTDQEVYTMEIPNFLALETEEFRPDTYVAPPYSTASTSLCWRYDPKDESQLQSNARIVQWEDGSLTLQLASNPKEQYRIASKPLAPRNQAGNYDPSLDSHTYLAAAAETASVFKITSYLTHQLKPLPTNAATDDAIQRLQEGLAAAGRTGKANIQSSGIAIIDIKEDPELAGKRAEAAERLKLREDRKRQQYADREQNRTARRPTYRSARGGLTAAGLEDDDGMLATRPAKKRPRANRRGEIYSDDEEDTGRRRQDSYEVDDFVADDDEELEEVDDASGSLPDDEMDAEGESDDQDVPSPPRKGTEVGAGSPPTRKKNRYRVEDDDDEE